jgi:hypothetical protein
MRTLVKMGLFGRPGEDRETPTVRVFHPNEVRSIGSFDEKVMGKF